MDLAWIIVDVVNIVYDSLFGALASPFGTLNEFLNPHCVGWLISYVSSHAQIIRFGWPSGSHLNDQVADH
jgi:hypothetical protein